MKKKIILLGASSLLASKFNTVFINFEIFNFSRSNIINYDNFFKLDIYDIKKLNDLFDYIKPDFVFNFIANTSISECENSDQTYVNNFFSNKIVNLCLILKIKYVFISTDQVYYNSLSSENINLKVNQKSSYAKQKRLSEIYIENNLDNFLIIRTNFFDYSKIKANNLIGYIFNNKNIDAFNDFKFKTIHTIDLLNIILILIERNYKGVYNIACNEFISKFEFINLILTCHNLSKKINIIKAPKKFKDLRFEVELNLNKISENIMLPSLFDSVKKINFN